jgi:hypothetical protein
MARQPVWADVARNSNGQFAKRGAEGIAAAAPIVVAAAPAIAPIAIAAGVGIGVGFLVKKLFD